MHGDKKRGSSHNSGFFLRDTSLYSDLASKVFNSDVMHCEKLVRYY